MKQTCPSCGESMDRRSGLCRPCFRQRVVTIFWAKVDRSGPVARIELGPCWLWLGHVKPNGYGMLTAFGKKAYAHRFAYQQVRGSIPAGLDLDHLCRVRRCVNPAHLEPVTRQVNLLRGRQAIAFVDQVNERSGLVRKAVAA